MSDPVTDALTADAAAGEAASSRQRPRSRFVTPADGKCRNCDTPLRGRVCHSCGQDSDNFNRPIWFLFWEILDGMAGIDGKLWRTLPKLMFQPGRLTRHYLAGVRGRYMQPFRLFLLASIVFIFLVGRIFTGSGGEETVPIDDPAPEAVEALAEVESRLRESRPDLADEFAVVQQEIIGNELETDSATESLETPEMLALRRERAIQQMRRYLLPEDYPEPTDVEPADGIDGEIVDIPVFGNVELSDFEGTPSAFRRALANQLEVIVRDPSRWFEAMQESMTYLFIILLPIHALILAIGQLWRRGFYFYDHLIVSLHFHAFILILLIALNLLGPLLNEWAILVFVLWSNFYVYRLHRVVYEHGRIMSVLRTLSLDFTYAIVLSIALVVLMIVGIFAA
jgi:Protein of unknown function (DUF3667)